MPTLKEALRISWKKRSLAWAFNLLGAKWGKRPARKPVSLMIEPTNICNLKCPTCPTGNGTLNRKKGYMPLEDFRRIVDEVADSAISCTLFNYGESFLHPQWHEMTRYLAERGIAPLISTNGTFLKRAGEIDRILDAGFEHIKVAIDGATQESYAAFRRGGNLHEIKEGLTQLVRARNTRGDRRPTFEIQYILMKTNAHELPLARQMARDCGVDQFTEKSLWIDILSPDFPQLAKDYLPDQGEDLRYVRGDDGEYRLKGEVQPGCPWVNRTLVINCDGEAVPCCYDIHSDMPLGNVSKQGLDAVWHGEAMTTLRRRVVEEKTAIPRCAVCPEGRVDIYLQQSAPL